MVRDVVHQLTGPDRPPELNAAKTFGRSELFWTAIELAKRELVARVLRDRALDATECATTLSGVIEAYAEARLFRMSMFIRLTEGDNPGPITGKGKTKALYLAYVQALDRERPRRPTKASSRVPARRIRKARRSSRSLRRSVRCTPA
jgi:hypothetical protein